jgi:hypothetical protein
MPESKTGVSSFVGLVFSELPQPLVSGAHDTARPIPRAIISGVIPRGQFARAVTEPGFVKPADRFPLVSQP